MVSNKCTTTCLLSAAPSLTSFSKEGRLVLNCNYVVYDQSLSQGAPWIILAAFWSKLRHDPGHGGKRHRDAPLENARHKPASRQHMLVCVCGLDAKNQKRCSTYLGKRRQGCQLDEHSQTTTTWLITNLISKYSRKCWKWKRLVEVRRIPWQSALKKVDPGSPPYRIYICIILHT